MARPFAGDRLHRRPRAENQVPQGLSGDRRRAGVRAGDKIQCDGRRRRRAFPTWCARRSASRSRAARGRCICSFAATRARSISRKPRWSRWSSRSLRACRRSGPSRQRDARQSARLHLLQNAERPVIVAGGGVRASGAAAELVALAEALQIPVATSLNGKDAIPGTIRCRSASSAPIRARAPTARSSRRSRLLHRHRDRRHDHAFLGGAARSARRRSRSTSSRSRSAAIIRSQAAVYGDAKIALARMLEHADVAALRGARPGLRRRRDLRADWRDKYSAALASDAVPIHPERICGDLSQHLPDDAIVVVDTGHAGMWMGGMYDLREVRARAISAAPAISAGRSRPASAPNAALPGPAGRGVHGRCRFLVSHRRNRDRGALEASMRSRSSTTTAAAISPSAASTAPMAASRPSRRASCGPSTR